jgi:hypothetical protein
VGNAVNIYVCQIDDELRPGWAEPAGWMDISDEDKTAGFKGTRSEVLSEIDNLRFELDCAAEEVRKWGTQ